MKVRVTAEEFQEKHARRLKAAEPDIRAGIEKVTTAPGILAAGKVAKMRARLLAKIDDHTWENRTKAVSLTEWQSKATTKGLPRISEGIDAAKEKTIETAKQLLPAVESAATKVETMPDLTLEDNILRSSTYIREMAKFKKK
uniref:Uncharacterized protein n=1 Tax=viral metagenome TaxID=1070528 RepID=A0A6M3JKW6_9ZZZZ